MPCDSCERFQQTPQPWVQEETHIWIYMVGRMDGWLIKEYTFPFEQQQHVQSSHFTPEQTYTSWVKLHTRLHDTKEKCKKWKSNSVFVRLSLSSTHYALKTPHLKVCTWTRWGKHIDIRCFQSVSQSVSLQVSQSVSPSRVVQTCAGGSRGKRSAFYPPATRTPRIPSGRGVPCSHGTHGYEYKAWSD